MWEKSSSLGEIKGWGEIVNTDTLFYWEWLWYILTDGFFGVSVTEMWFENKKWMCIATYILMYFLWFLVLLLSLHVIFFDFFIFFFKWRYSKGKLA